MAPDPEILSGEPVRLGRWRVEPEPPPPVASGLRQGFSRRQRIAATVVVCTVAAGWYADRRIAEHESTSIAACDRELRAASHEYDVRLGAMYDYVRPSLGEADPAIGRLLSSLMAEPAKQVLPAATAAAGSCRGVRVLAWHSANVAHRNADRAYAAALVVRLHDVASARHPFQLTDEPLSRLRAAAGIPAALGS